MKINIGDKLDDIKLPSVDGSSFSLHSLKGKKVLLTFYRFARCPMCNLRINEIIKRYDELGNDFAMVGIFDSKISNLQKAMSRHDLSFTILADENYEYLGNNLSFSDNVGLVMSHFILTSSSFHLNPYSSFG